MVTINKRINYAKDPIYRQIYSSWKKMRDRCNNPNSAAYINYGGRGIKVCEEWNNFHIFLKDMGLPDKNYSIDRKNVNGNYDKSNCKWSSKTEQSRNKRNTLYFQFNNETASLPELAEKYSQVPLNIIYNRILKKKWTIDKALLEPYIVERKSYYNYNGEYLKFKDICKKYSTLSPKTISTRFHRAKWSLHDALTIPLDK
jgi:hypothetical protein